MRGYEDSPEKRVRLQREIRFMQKRWGAVVETDPSYNPNRSMRTGGYTLPLPKHSLTFR